MYSPANKTLHNISQFKGMVERDGASRQQKLITAQSMQEKVII